MRLAESFFKGKEDCAMSMLGNARSVGQVSWMRSDLAGSRRILCFSRTRGCAMRSQSLTSLVAAPVFFVKQRQSEPGNGRFGVVRDGYDARVEARRSSGDVDSALWLRFRRRIKFRRAAKRLVLRRRSGEPAGRLLGCVRQRVLLALRW